ncbi:MAG TPA: DUF4169 family protein [Xanthobacteraceae bacterium]|nr:DUF4169 family protein [Xanthobacteraceae bacterium]
MANIVNLRGERKRAKRLQADEKAAANRVLHGLPKAARTLAKSQRDQGARLLEGHRIGKTGDDR